MTDSIKRPKWGREVTVGHMTLREPVNEAAREAMSALDRALWDLYEHFAQRVDVLKKRVDALEKQHEKGYSG